MLYLPDPSARLEPFLLMSKSAKGAAAAKLVQDATTAPGVFVFAELAEISSVKELQSNPQYVSSYRLLQLFSYMTYEDYKQNKDLYPPLNVAQVNKLKHLSLVTYAMHKRILPYAFLQTALDLPSIRELEDVIIEATYAGAIRGKLDQQKQEFQVEWIMGRDLAPGALEELLKGLQDWSNTTSALLTRLDNAIIYIQSSETTRTSAIDNHNNMQQKALAEAMQGMKSGRTGGVPPPSGPKKNNVIPSSLVDEDRMDVDEVTAEAKKKK
ncbi:hypothetical protein Clacol_003824 [Clathrus columnatus]|uniref:PCI domain-containing protein n=1 Tax=Clathrus columnatus TaxID=1419009 RepID=A0AAV5A4M6_9AGAM|nr:hypothetical protein Clacol_003824 [Clathrus columnatus]